MNRILVIGFFIACIFVACNNAQSQQAIQSQYKFKHITVDQNLSHNNVRSICQDSIGYIWIATTRGVDKFDGQTIVPYSHNPQDSCSISSNNVFVIFLDSENNIWFGSSEGLDIFNSKFNNFIRFTHKDIKWPINNVNTIAEDKNKKLWFGTNIGLYAYDLITSEIQYFSNKKGNLHGIPSDQIVKLIVDRNNNILFSVFNEGLYIYNQDKKTIRRFKNNPGNNTNINDRRIYSLYEDKNGNIWAGLYDYGFHLYVPENDSFIRIIPDPENIYSLRVRTIFEDMNDDLFIGTRAGLYIKNKLNNKFIHYAYEDHDFSILSQNSIYCSYIDKTGTLWIGTHSGGLNYADLRNEKFVLYSAKKNNQYFLSGPNIYAITEDLKGNLWIGGNYGLNYLDRNTNTFKYYFNDPNNSYSLSHNDIKSLEWDKKRNLWIGTNKGGLNYLNFKTGKFISYKPDTDNPNSIGDKIYCLLNDDYNNLWIIAQSIEDPGYNNIFTLPNGSDKFVKNNEQAWRGLDQDEKGNILIGGINGFWIFYRADSLYNFISNDTLIGYVNIVMNDSENKLWIGSDKGLVRYDMEKKLFRSFSQKNGYPVDEVFGILEDDTKSLWVSTNSGLIEFKNIVEETNNVTYKVFDSKDGLQSKQFNSNAYYKCRSGEMIFGGINGFNIFHPGEIIDNSIPPNVVITELKIFNKSVPIGEKVRGRRILNKSISVTDEIILGRKQNVFTLKFAALHYANPEKNIFKYKLDGFDEDWQIRKASNNFVTYSNLPFGKYTFILTAANSDGVWNKKPIELKIIIVPPYWKTWWFRMLVSIVLIGLVWGIYLYRVRLIKQQNILLEETVKKRTQKISEQKEEIFTQKEELEQHRNKLELLVKERTAKLEAALEKAKESDLLKSTFLANMSHEIRTPMNAIKGFTSLLSDDDLTTEEQAKYIQIIESNSNNLLKIIDEILDLSLIESNQLKLTKEIFDLNVMIDHLYSYYYLNNNNPDIELRKKNTLESLNLKFYNDVVRIKQIIINFMDNANKFTKKGYIELGTYIDNDNLCIYVEDTGRGIPSNSIDHIFQQFTKVEDEEAGWTKGLGLGLAISQKITNALDGKIIVQSVLRKGSKFTFSISLNKMILDQEKEITIQEPKESLPTKWKGKTILIAEDVEENYLYLKKALKKTQTNIIWAKNGEEALKLTIESPKIDLVLMDIKMPKMNGTDAAKKIKEHNPNQVIIAQTAYARPEEKSKFYSKDFDDYISKPIHPIDLFRLLSNYL